MDKYTLAKNMFGKESVVSTSEQVKNTGATMVYMIAVTSSSNGRVVLKNEDSSLGEWEEGTYIELDDDGNFEDFELDEDPMADVGGPVLDFTDGDGVDIEDYTGEISDSLSLAAYHENAVMLALENSIEDYGEVTEDDEVMEDYTVSEEVDDGDASDLPDIGDGADDDVVSEDATVKDTSDADFVLRDDIHADDESDELEGVEISDGCTVADCIGSVKAGDRVAVLIQNGAITVIGSVGSGDADHAYVRDNDVFASNTQEGSEITNEVVSDLMSALGNAQDTVGSMSETVSGLTTELGNTQETVDSITKQLSSIIVDSSGSPLMESVDGGWRYNLGLLLEQVNAATLNAIDTNSELGVLTANVSKLAEFMKQLEPIMEYFQVGVDEAGTPNLIIGRKSGRYGVRITDEKVDFIDGNSVPAYISNQSLNIGRAITNDELQIGDYLLRQRANGNLCLVWKGGE